MKPTLTGVAVVKNEADIIEASVRHNLAFLDRLVVVDHSSTDETPAILVALQREGLALELRRMEAPHFRHGAVMTQLARELLRGSADVVVPIDADEFLWGASRDLVRAQLAAVSPHVFAMMPWRQHLPSLGGEGCHPFLRGLRRLETSQPTLPKIVIGKGFADRDDLAVFDGNHFVHSLAHGTADPVAKELGDVALLHVPFRSREQLLAKVLIGWGAHRLATLGAGSTLVGDHWRRLAEHFLAGGDMALSDAATIITDAYLRPPGSDPAAAIDVTMEDASELAAWAVPLTHTPKTRIDPLRLHAQWTQRLIDDLDRRTSARH